MAIRILVGGGRFDKALPERERHYAFVGQTEDTPAEDFLGNPSRIQAGFSLETLPIAAMARSLLRSARSRHLPEAP